MPSFGQRSIDNLKTCHPKLIQVMQAAIIDGPDFSVICGHRSVEEQQELYAIGRTKPGKIVTHVDGIEKLSNHNHFPSLAVDIAPYPIDWDNREQFFLLAGYVMATARSLKIPLRWGADWNQNFRSGDETFIDLPHFELLPEKN